MSLAAGGSPSLSWSCTRLTQLAGILSLCFSLTVGHAVSIIPDSRRIEWKPGVPGGIPNYPVFAAVTDGRFGAVGDGRTDDSRAIQAAVEACPPGMALFFPAGTYWIEEPIVVRDKGIVLRGAGPDRTRILNASDGATVSFTRWTSLGTASGITGGSAKGSRVIETREPGHFREGDFVYLSQLNDPDVVRNQGYGSKITWGGLEKGERSMVQLNRISRIEGNRLHLVRPLYWTFEPWFEPLVQRITLVQGAGLEDLRVEQVQGLHTSNAQNIQMSGLAHSWVRNVVSLYPRGAHIQLRNSFQCEVRDSDFLNAAMTGSGRGYGIFIFGPNSDHLVENNVISRSRHSLIFEGGGSGCVIAYNYACDVTESEDDEWLPGDADTHGAHPYMNLFEGNIFAKLAHDNTFGSASHNTSFRNHITNRSRGKSRARWAVDIQANNYFNNVVGNIVGEPGDQGLVEPDKVASTGTLVSYRFGFLTPGSSESTDLRVRETTLVHGNHDYISGEVRWAGEISGRGLPSSLYLTVAPPFFGDTPWPSIGPDLDPMCTPIPAKQRFERLYGRPQPPRGLSVAPVESGN
jgi:hypothetical protein